MQTPLEKSAAVKQFVTQLSSVPTHWLSLAAEAIQESPVLFPDWGTTFLIHNTVDQRGIRDLFRPITDATEDRQVLAEYGWSEVSDTGILARDLEDDMLLGIHGGGYDFYEAHWTPLYEQLGYTWHE